MTKIELTHKYVSILRCATWHVWPERTQVLSKTIIVPIDEQTGFYLYGSIHLVSYENRPRVKIYSAKESRETGSPILWRGRLKSRYLVGESIIKAPEDMTAYKLHFEHAYKGEIDIQFHFATDRDPPQDELLQVVLGVSLSVMSLINIELGDLMTPVAPIRIGEITEQGLQSSSNFKILVWNRATISHADLQNTIDKYASIFSFDSRSYSSSAKMRIALELYAAHFSERAMSTRFLMLIMALEALIPNSIKSKIALNLLEQWKQQVSDLKSKLPSDSDEYISLEGLERELLFRRENSIRSQIRQMVYDVLFAGKNPKATELSRRVVKVYDQRSALVHEGALPIGELAEAEHGAKEIIELVLKAMFRLDHDNT
jgi:hypothetical protein